jgi:hypothetical protein
LVCRVSLTGKILFSLLWPGTTHLWHLIAFGYHQFRADGKPKDGLFRQQQAIIRQLSTPSALIADATKLWCSWRNKADHALIASLAPLSLALVCAIGGIAASLASSYVIDSSGVEVLISSPYCGSITVTESQHSERTYINIVEAMARTYATDCYPIYNQTIGSLPARCQVFIRPSVPLQVETVECPFSPKICKGSKENPSMGVAVDSGLVDVNDAFGLNLANKDRVKFRKRTTCGVLQHDDYTKVVNTSIISSAMGDVPGLPGEGKCLISPSFSIYRSNCVQYDTESLIFQYGRSRFLENVYSSQNLTWNSATRFIVANLSSGFGTT